MTIWIILLLIGVVVLGLGIVLPRRELQVIGAIVAIVGAIGWLAVGLGS